MAGRTTPPDLEETMREPLALTCFMPAVEVPVFAEADTGYIEKRPARVIVRPARPEERKRPLAPARTSPPPWRPERARPQPVRPIGGPPAPRRKVSPRSDTIKNRRARELDLRSLAMFWGVALAGSLVAIGIALTAW